MDTTLCAVKQVLLVVAVIEALIVRLLLVKGEIVRH